MQFTIVDNSNPSATPGDILKKLATILGLDVDDLENDEGLSQLDSQELLGEADEEEDDQEPDTSDETDDLSKPEKAAKKQRKLRLKRLRRKTISRAYEFTGGSDVTGIVFLEIKKIVDLPPERNSRPHTERLLGPLADFRTVTRTSFDMDPFVVASLGRKTYRTRVIRHNLNPIFEEKMVFQVMRHEQNYSMSFSVIDRDKLSGNDFVGTANFPLSNLISIAPEADSDTGLYSLPEPPDSSLALPQQRSRFRLPMSRSSSATSLSKMARPSLHSRASQSSMQNSPYIEQPNAPTSSPNDPTHLAPTSSLAAVQDPTEETSSPSDDPLLNCFTLPLILKNKDRWEDKHSPQLTIKAKYLPYPALRQQFWRAMLKQYDSDENARLSKVELTTMLDTLGSTLKESTIDGFFSRYSSGMEMGDPLLTYDQAVTCLEDQLTHPVKKKTWGETMRGAHDTMKGYMDNAHFTTVSNGETKPNGTDEPLPMVEGVSKMSLNTHANRTAIPATEQDRTGESGEAGDLLAENDLTDERGEEHVVEIRECPLCHQPRLNKRSDADIITHIATCASQDWRQVNNIVMAGFVTSSQAQRKWYSKVITKISYGGYKLGANSANILVQDRLTGQINEERMSVYVRLGIRLLYKGMKSREMEKKRSKSIVRSRAELSQRLILYSPQNVKKHELQARSEVRRSSFGKGNQRFRQLPPAGHVRSAQAH